MPELKFKTPKAHVDPPVTTNAGESVPRAYSEPAV